MTDISFIEKLEKDNDIKIGGQDVWKNKQNKGFSVCVHCTKDDLLLHTTTVDCCSCCCYPWKKNKSILKKEVTNFD